MHFLDRRGFDAMDIQELLDGGFSPADTLLIAESHLSVPDIRNLVSEGKNIDAIVAKAAADVANPAPIKIT